MAHCDVLCISVHMFNPIEEYTKKRLSQFYSCYQGQLMTADCSTAQQSSTNRPGWNDADRACDGVTDTDYRNPQHCAHTQSSTDNWWQVELLLVGPVAAVEIYFRSDCCRTCAYRICVYFIYFLQSTSMYCECDRGL